ncbi:LysR substrate-binding domain-containing protein [Octadecabacter sp. 1_MG-2023]|uniref:LysR substrate-binding domain-containing protein n=1 Tax=unclassified Octadecabacter TaxID=196158 RepID=UPI001C09A765|nr:MULTISPECIES: LysR substrate-binding domain-containing protein [unclassified Octadecabacter]MBU2993685.1 LysR family transcriptional regulator [Octadecabacter sp. B2R22]MDO6735471.1 LysR substrate-binding domain-containing protein [Octadecabacter sp. 1_MG-2023]
MRRLPHVTWLSTFEAAARHGSFAAAADELSLTPAAVSQHIKLLEQTLEMKLFKRLPKGVELTDIGQAYAQPVRQSFVDLQTATDGLFQTQKQTTLHVRASISFGVIVLVPRLHEFRALHPEINIVVSTTVWSNRLNDATIDVDLRYGNGDWPERDIWQLRRGHASLICSPHVASTLQGDPNQLETADIVNIVGSENDWPRMFSELGVNSAVPSAWMSVESSLLALESIAAGRGIAIVDTLFTDSYVKRGDLVVPFEQAVPTTQNFYLVADPDRKTRSAVACFRDWIDAIVK